MSFLAEAATAPQTKIEYVDYLLLICSLKAKIRMCDTGVEAVIKIQEKIYGLSFGTQKSTTSS